MVMISPSASSPALSTVEDNGLFFRSAPSDLAQGAAIAKILMEKGLTSAAITYTNNDYGKGLADVIENTYKELGGSVTISIPHEDGKGDYGAEVGSLAQAGGDILVVVGYPDQGGKGIIQASLDAGAYDQFFLPDAMIVPALAEAIGPDLNGSIGTVPGIKSAENDKFKQMMTDAGFEPGAYTGESYDAVALMAFAMQAAGSTSSSDYKDKVFEVANAPGEKILPGELAKGLEILAAGGDIDYVGATAIELIGPGETAGNYAEILVDNQEFTEVAYH